MLQVLGVRETQTQYVSQFFCDIILTDLYLLEVPVPSGEIHFPPKGPKPVPAGYYDKPLSDNGLGLTGMVAVYVDLNHRGSIRVTNYHLLQGKEAGIRSTGNIASHALDLASEKPCKRE